MSSLDSPETPSAAIAEVVSAAPKKKPEKPDQEAFDAQLEALQKDLKTNNAKLVSCENISGS